MSPARRRPAALRVVAGVLLVTASGAIVLGTGLAAVLSSSLAGWTTAAVVVGVLAVAGGAVAVRLTHTELMLTRRRAAADRTEQARAYAAAAELRAADHRSHVDRLRTRLDERGLSLLQLQELLVATQRRLAEERQRADRLTDRMVAAERGAEAADDRAAAAMVTVAELELEVVDLRATLAAWEDAHPGVRPALRSAV